MIVAPFSETIRNHHHLTGHQSLFFVLLQFLFDFAQQHSEFIVNLVFDWRRCAFFTICGMNCIICLVGEKPMQNQCLAEVKRWFNTI